jgi:hypothetical protein
MALANSYNVTMVKLLDRLGVERMLEVARSMGISSLDQSKDFYGLSLTLGGGEVTLLDLTTAYHTIADGGIYRKPQIVREIRDVNGNPIPEDVLVSDEEAVAQATVEPAEESQNSDQTQDQSDASADTQDGSTEELKGEPQEGEAVLDPATAFLVTDILSDESARQSAFGADNPLVLSRPAAAKTGTTTDYRDNWTVGFTRYLVAGVWAGNSDGHPMHGASGVTGAAPIWHDFMEGVLSNPDLLARLEAPDDPAQWQFGPPPAGVVQMDSCPPTLACRTGGEFFRKSWIDAEGNAGPLGDSVAQLPSAAVYVQKGDQSHFAGFCGDKDGVARTMLLLPGMKDKSEGAGKDGENDANPLPTYFEVKQKNGVQAGQNISDTEALQPEMTLAQQHVLAWAVHTGGPVYLGACDRLKDYLPGALAMDPQDGDKDLRVLVDLAGAGDPNTAAAPANGAVPAEAIQRAVAVEGLTGSGTAAGLAQGIVNDSSCPGNYVMGTVVNQDGAPLPGIRLEMTDQWGNHTYAVSKDGQNDFGHFDFPIYGDGAQNLQLVVVDGNNNPIGAPVIVPHKMDAASNAPCQHVTIRAD